MTKNIAAYVRRDLNLSEEELKERFEYIIRKQEQLRYEARRLTRYELEKALVISPTKNNKHIS